jgi:DNA-directed RNA polymerase specialized sigma24 family protein
LVDESESQSEDRLSQCHTLGETGETGGQRQLSEEEVEERLSSLTQADWLKLAKYGRGLTRGPDGDDLAQAACVRILEGGRGWTENMKTVPFIFGVMRSILDQWRSKGSLKTVPIDGMSGGQLRAFEVKAADTITAERELIAKRELKEIEALFLDDENATWVLTGIEDDTPAKEIQEFSGMSLNEYEAARKRVARRLMRCDRDGTFK